MHPTTIALRSQPCRAPAAMPLAIARLSPHVAPAAQKDYFVFPESPDLAMPEEADTIVPEEAGWTEQAPIDASQSAPWTPEVAGDAHLEGRAGTFDVLKDFIRELASSMQEAYATLSQDGFVEATRLLTSHLAQLFVGTSAFFIFNMGRRLSALWQRLGQLFTG